MIGRHLLCSVETSIFRIWSSSKSDSGDFAMLPAESYVDVVLGPWKNIGLTNVEVSSSVRSWSS